MTRTPSRSPVLDTILPNIRKQIKSCGPGGKIPTIRELSDTLGASQVTVRQAIQLLEQEGLVKAYVGRGTYVTENDTDKQEEVASKTVTILRSDWPSRRGEELTRSIYQATREHGYRPAVVTYTDYPQIKNLLRAADESDAYILQPTSQCSVQLLAFLRSLSPNVLVEGMELTNADIDSITPDWQKSIVMGLAHLRNNKHQSIMLVTGEPKLTQSAQIEYCRTVMQLTGLKHDDSVIGIGDTQPGQCSTQGAREYVTKLIAQNNGKLPCTAMLVLSYASAVGIVEALQLAGLKISKDVELVVIDNPDIDTELAKRITLVGVTSVMTGQAIIDRLEHRWNQTDINYQTLYTQPMLKKAGDRLSRANELDLSER